MEFFLFFLNIIQVVDGFIGFCIVSYSVLVREGVLVDILIVYVYIFVFYENIIISEEFVYCLVQFVFFQ